MDSKSLTLCISNSNDFYISRQVDYYQMKKYEEDVENYLKLLKNLEQAKPLFMYVRIKTLYTQSPFADWKCMEMLRSYVFWEVSKLKQRQITRIQNFTLLQMKDEYQQDQMRLNQFVTEQQTIYNKCLEQINNRSNIISDTDSQQSDQEDEQQRGQSQHSEEQMQSKGRIIFKSGKKDSQQQHQEQSLKSQYTKSYPIRKNKEGYSKVFRCSCGYKYHQKKRVLLHISKCEKSKTIIRKSTIIKGKIFQQPSQPQFEQEVVQQMDNIEEIVSKIIQDKLEKYDLVRSKNFSNPRKMAEQIYSNCEAGIKNSLIVNLTAAVQKATNTFNRQDLISTSLISKNLLGFIGSIDFDSITINFSQQLTKAHRNIQARIDQKSKTYRNNQLAYNILQRFTELDLKFHISIFNEMTMMTVFPRKNISRYWRLIKKANGYFQNFPDLPLFRDTIIRHIKLTPVSIQEAGAKVLQIFKQDSTLASDMWLIITIGLRSTDLQKIRLFDEDGNGILICKVKENKNNHISQRYIPQSVIEIAAAAQAPYPMSQIRLKSAIKRCLKQFKSAYGFKHRALTTIITSLYQSNSFARFHKRAQTTIKHYLDTNDTKLLDKAFTLPQHFILNQQTLSKVTNRKICVDLTGKKEVFYTSDSKKSSQINIECQNLIEERIIASVQDGFRPERPFIQEVEQHLGELWFIANNHQVELVESKHQNIEEVIGQLNQNSEVYQLIEDGVYLDNENSNIREQKQHLFCKELAEVSKRSVQYYQFSGSEIDPVDSYKYTVQSSEEPLIISKSIKDGKKKFKLSSNVLQLDSIPERPAKIAALNKMKQWPFMTIRQPKCPQCFENRIVSLLATTEHGVICPSCCRTFDQIKEENIPWKKARVIKSYGQYFDSSEIKPMPLSKQKNNLRQHIDNFGFQSQFHPSFLQRLETNFMKFDLDINKKLKYLNKNVDYLGLEVRQSRIENCGKGLFSTLIIPQNSLIMNYVGSIATNKFSNLTSNSLFTLGWVHKDNSYVQVLSDGCLITNGSRLFNSSIDKKKANIIVRQGVLQQTSIQIIFISKRRIEADQELTFWYGHRYWESISENGQQQDDDQ